IAGPSPAMTERKISPAMTERKASSSGILFSSLSSSGKRSATRGSMDVRVKPEHDIEKKPEDDNYLLVIPVLDTGICKEDPRVKPEGDCSNKL
ncbi:MAG: hypothetical protein ACLUH4_08435, partial [Alphaproteobacteria bacterium]